MAKAKGVNAKQQAGRDRKAANQAAKDAAAAQKQEELTAAEWKKGSNVKRAEQEDLSTQKADDLARKRAEKAKLLAAEEEGVKGSVKKVKGATGKKKKKGNDTSLLDEALLVGNADKKVKAAKKAERERKEREERLRIEREKNKKVQETKQMDPLMANTQSMIGDTIGDNNASLNSNAVKGGGTIDHAIQDLSLGDAAKSDPHPEKRIKALHKEFEERMLPQMKEEFPGLRLSQYKERIFALWKKSPENPMNWKKEETQDGTS